MTQTATSSTFLALIHAELAALEQRRTAFLHILSVYRRAAARTAAPVRRMVYPRKPRPFNRALYQTTVRMVSSWPSPITTKELAVKLRAKRLSDTSMYSHLYRAVKRGDLARVGNGYHAAPKGLTR